MAHTTAQEEVWAVERVLVAVRMPFARTPGYHGIPGGFAQALEAGPTMASGHVGQSAGLPWAVVFG